MLFLIIDSVKKIIMAYNTEYLSSLTDLDIVELDFNELNMHLKNLGIKIGRNKTKKELQELLTNSLKGKNPTTGIYN